MHVATAVPVSSANSSTISTTVGATRPDPQRLRQILGQAKLDLDVSRLPDLEQAVAGLQQQLLEVENYIQPVTSNGEAWSRFLRLDEIREEISKPAPNPAALADLELNLHQNYDGLDSPALLGLREALNEVKRAARYGGNPERTIQVFEARIQSLLDGLDDALNDPSKLSEDVGRIVNYLYEANQAPHTIQQLRNQFNAANVEFYASEAMLNKIASQAVAEPSPVDECILGTRVLGRACLTGSLGLDLLPMQQGVAINLNLSGRLTSNNRGYNRGVVLRTTGTSPVFASKRIVVTEQGISADAATVATNLQTSIHAIEHKLRLVRRIAKRKAAEQKPQADAIAQGRMQRRLRSQYDSQVEERLSEARGQLKELQSRGDVQTKLRRFDIAKPALAVYSTTDSVRANVVQAAAFQLAAAAPCPLPSPTGSEVVVRIHQSLLINALESFLADRTVRSSDIDELAKQLVGEIPEEMQEENASDDPWEITMVAFNPVQLAFDDDQVRLSLRFTRMEGSDRVISGGAVVTVVYRPEFDGGVLRLTRVGDIDIQLPGVRSRNQATVLRSAARAKLEPIFQPQLETERVDLRQRFPRLPKLDLESLRLDEGWLQVGIR